MKCFEDNVVNGYFFKKIGFLLIKMVVEICLLFEFLEYWKFRWYQK